MKRISCLIVILLSAAIFSQTPNWTSVKETNIWVGSSSGLEVDIFTNGYGNHVIVQRPSELKYFKMNVNGTATDSVLIESSSVISPSISGNENTLYCLQKKQRKFNKNKVQQRWW